MAELLYDARAPEAVRDLAGYALNQIYLAGNGAFDDGALDTFGTLDPEPESCSPV